MENAESLQNRTETLRQPLSRRTFLRGSAAAAIAGIYGTALAACGTATAKSNVLTVWGFPGTIEGLQSILPTFRQRYPQLDVHVQVFDYATVHTNLLNALVTSTGAPDLVAIDSSYLASYAPGVLDLADKRWQASRDFLPPVTQLSSYRGKFCGLVTDSEPMALAYRKDIWDRYGLHENDIETWDDLAAASDQLHQRSAGRIFMYPMLSNETSTYEVLAVEQGFGGYYFSDDDRSVIVDDPKVIAAVSVLKRLWESPGVYRNPQGGYTGDEATTLLKNGKLAAQLCPGWYPETLKQNMPEQAGKWRLMRLPAVQRGGPRVGYQYPTIFVIPKDTQYATEAWTLEHMGLTGSGARHLYETAHVLPAAKAVFDENIPKPDKFFGGQHVFSLWQEISADSPRIMFGDGLQEAQAIMGKNLAHVFNGTTSPAAAMHTAAADMRLKLNKG